MMMIEAESSHENIFRNDIPGNFLTSFFNYLLIHWKNSDEWITIPASKFSL